MPDIQLAQGIATPATTEDLARDAAGITKPNLHRRIDADLSQFIDNVYLATTEGDLLATESNEVLVIPGFVPDPNATYLLSVNALNSYRTTKRTIHDEESTISEIP